MKDIKTFISGKMKGGNARSSLIFRNILASFVIKGWSVVVQLLLVPLTLACLGVYENGVWLTISSVLLWIDNLDIGMGNGLRNKLATYIARNDMAKAKEMVSSTFAMLIVISIPTAIMLIAAVAYYDTYNLFNVNPDIVSGLDTILIVAIILVCSTFTFKFLGNFYMGLQLPAVNNLLVTSGNTIALIGTYIIYRAGVHSLLLIAVVNTAAPLAAYLVCYPITFCWKYKHLTPSVKYVRLAAAKELFTIGMNFFTLQISGVVLFFSSNIIISKLFSPSMVTPYQIAHRYFMVAMLLFTIICTPYWSATTDAYERKDYGWIKKANKTLNRFMIFICICIALMILLSDFIYGIWIGGKADIPLTMTIIVGVYELVLIWSTRYSFVLNGIGVLRLQLIMTIIASTTYIPLAILVGRYTGDINWLLVVMCSVNIPGLVVNAVQYHKIINQTATGIWKK